MSLKKKIALGVFVILLLLFTGFVIWASNPLGPDQKALDALKSTDSVKVTQGDFITFEPTTVEANVGMIFYPGGRVAAESYAVLAKMIAEEGYFVVIAPMTLNLAVLSPNKADAVMETYPQIGNWTIAGHSLGGAMAAAYVYDNPRKIRALYLLASYPPDSNDLSSFDLDVVSLYGTNDKVLDVDIESTAHALPENATIIAIEGGNHAYFGYYGEQPGDGDATISRETQHQITVDAITLSLGNLQ